jgi:hypothetical protein
MRIAPHNIQAWETKIMNSILAPRHANSWASGHTESRTNGYLN